MKKTLLQLLKPMLMASSLMIISYASNAQLGKCKGKYFGNIIANSATSGAGLNYTTLWNQATSENGSKWGSVEGSQGSYSWTTSDIAYNWAKNNSGLFKYHNFVWGSQTPNWVANASVATITASVENYIKACSTHYTPMGGLKMIDVVNEPVNTALSTNYKAALTAGYQAEPANANDKNNQYGWIIWSYQLARKYFPNAVLLINEYNVEHDWNSCRAPYIAMVNAVKNAPNITDGKKNLIDGVGLQCHGVDGMTPTTFKACIDEIWNKTGVPIHITEFDAAAKPDEAAQTKIFSDLIPVAWEHPHVAGITFWGYIQGTTWINGNGTKGASGTDSGIMYADGTARPAYTWLKNYISGKSDLTCCPAPAPFAACTNGASPTVSISVPTNNATFAANANVAITAAAADADGTISKVEFYNGTTKLGQSASTSSPYSYTWNAVAEGFYTITAVATDNSGNVTTSTAVSITVGNPSVEILTNGEFDNSTTGWTLQNNSTGVGTMSVVTTASQSGANALKICPTTPGTADWHVQVQQAAPIENGKTYQISFMAKADAARTIGVGVQQNVSPYKMRYSQTVSLTTTNQAFTYTFTADTTDAGSQFKFFAGNNASCVYIDKVSMKNVVVTGLNDNALSNNIISVYPNPFNTEFVLNASGDFEYSIENLSGVTIETGSANETAIVGGSLSAGLYIVKVKQQDLTKVIKVIKQ